MGTAVSSSAASSSSSWYAVRLAWRFRRVLWQREAYFANDANALEMRGLLTSSGPLFVKLGQWLSQRPELVPPTFARHLSTLQHDAPKHAWADTQAILAAAQFDLDHFESFAHEPIASGSIAQVYRARARASLFDADAADANQVLDVAVKVRHPNVVAEFRAGLGALRVLYDWAKWYWPEQKLFHLVDFDSVADDMLTQCDLRHEGSVMRDFADNFAHNAYVHVPTALAYTDAVLIETFEHGVRLDQLDRDVQFDDDAERVRCKALCLRVLQATYMQMTLHDGLAHGDCHNGNVLFRVHRKPRAVLARERIAAARLTDPDMALVSAFDVSLVLLDFGIYVRLDNAHRRNHLRIMVGIFGDDGDEVSAALRELMAHNGVACDDATYEQFRADCETVVSALHAQRRNKGGVSVSDQIMAVLGLLHKYRIVIGADVVRTMVGWVLIEQGRYEVAREHVSEQTMRWILYEDSGENFPLVPYVSHLMSALVTRDQAEPVGCVPPVADPTLVRDAERVRVCELQNACGSLHDAATSTEWNCSSSLQFTRMGGSGTAARRRRVAPTKST